MSIKVSHVSKVYDAQRALDDVNFEIERGHIIGFLGPNGAGKSTMMKIITCFLPPTEGSVEVCGFDVSASPMEVKKRIGYLPEHNPLYPEMYVREYLEFVAGVHQIPNKKARVEEMIDLVGLSVERKKKIGALSKGYRQRVGLAQAMIHDPEVLILDEPTTGLDPNQIVEIRNLIKNIGTDRTVMLSTHIMQEVEAICDRVIIVNHGKIVADDDAANLLKFQDKLFIRVEFNKAVASNVLAQIAGVSEVKKISDSVWLLGSEGDKDIRQSVFDFAVKNDFSVLTIQKEEQRLEDIFKRLTTS
ncbi:MAG: gliding motility-associated ABC transporter ATP-binding subunit GldA [Flavobacteriales bacterium]|nr:gliding motility-associated ABC transporter ATP-binding subunit GldA [Flavobacteriales bacterium]